MSSHLRFVSLTDFEVLAFFDERHIFPFAQYSQLVFQPLEVQMIMMNFIILIVRLAHITIIYVSLV